VTVFKSSLCRQKAGNLLHFLPLPPLSTLIHFFCRMTFASTTALLSVPTESLVTNSLSWSFTVSLLSQHKSCSYISFMSAHQRRIFSRKLKRLLACVNFDESQNCSKSHQICHNSFNQVKLRVTCYKSETGSRFDGFFLPMNLYLPMLLCFFQLTRNF
jgi:hypothetical protein